MGLGDTSFPFPGVRGQDIWLPPPSTSPWVLCRQTAHRSHFPAQSRSQADTGPLPQISTRGSYSLESRQSSSP